jgi:pentatricopeptide repeat protein
MIIKRVYLLLFLLPFLLAKIATSQETQQTSKGKIISVEIDTTIWKYLSTTDRSQWTITKNDSEKAIKEYVVPGATTCRKAAEVNDKINRGQTNIEQEASNLISLFEQAKDYFEEGLRLNPFDNYTRPWLISTYSNLERLYAYTEEPAKRLQVLKNLLYLKNDPKDRLYLFSNIGTIYKQFEQYTLARNNYQLAVEAIFEGDETAIDTTKLFENIFLRGGMQLKLYEDEPALTSFIHARMIAPNQNFFNNITSLIDYINWDAGNIRASEKYKEARKLYSEKKYDVAEIAFLELLGSVQTEKARNQAQSDLARLQFYQLEKKDEAIDRLWNVVNRYPLDPDSGVPIDSTYQDIWEQYSQMCLRMGLDNHNTDKRASFIYFLKMSQIEGSSRGKAFLNLARMSLQNPQICLNYCTRALDYQEQLNKEEKKILYNTIYQIYLQQGDFEQALEWFKKYYEMSS